RRASAPGSIKRGATPAMPGGTGRRGRMGRKVAHTKHMKTTMILTLIGALIGVVAASLIVPPALAWYTAPGGLPQGAQIQAVVQIPEVIRYATSRLLHGQMI